MKGFTQKSLNQQMLWFCEKNGYLDTDTLKYSCMFDNGEWDYQAMARFIVEELDCGPGFEELIRKIHSAAFTDQYLIDRGLY